MLRTSRAFLLIAGLFALVSQAFAADPVTERPGQSTLKASPLTQQTVPVATPVASAKPLAVLEGREEWGNNGSLRFEVYAGGKVVMIDATQKPAHGQARVDGKRIQFIFGNCIYDGMENQNGVLVGQARYTEGADLTRTWNFCVTLRNPLAGPG